MKILIITVPLRDAPSGDIPYGALTIMNYVRKHGYGDVELYHIDDLRPSYSEAIEYIERCKPDILGVSAIVSTSYAFVKTITCDIKKSLPESLIVVGGNMGASAEVLLRKTGTDIVVIGEGDKAFLNIVKRAETTRKPQDFMDIKGLALINVMGQLHNSGYETPLPSEEIWDVDFEDLARATDINKVFSPAFIGDTPTAEWIAANPRSFEAHRRNKTIGHIAAIKGCVARCTFCHRWDRGLKHISIERVMKELDHHIEKYNCGFVMIFAETFGNDVRWLTEFCKEIKKRDVLWWSGGMRANAKAACPEWLEIMKDSGCTTLTYGNETGSEKMLQIMEKKVSIEDNYNSMKWTIEAGIYTGIQLVIGMPGETDDTIDETIKYCNFVTTLSPEKDPNYMSSNYAQALPGTPLYEFARHRGLIGHDIDSEEKYLLMVSDRNARDEKTTLNFTDQSTLALRVWRPRITIEVNYNFVRTFGLEQYLKVLTSTRDFKSHMERYYFNSFAKPEICSKTRMPSVFLLFLSGCFGLAMVSHPVLFYHIRKFLPVMVLLVSWKNEGLMGALKLLTEHLLFKFKITKSWPRFAFDYKSLRKIVSKDLGVLETDSPQMQPLRDGR